VGSPGSVAVDANGRFDTETALAYAHEMEPLGLRWYEEAGDPLDYELQAEVCRHYAPPVATGENLFSVQELRNLLRYAGMRSDRDIIQLDPALSYGLVEYLRVLDAMRDHGWSVRRCIPHGGHLFAVHIAAGLGTGGNESYPGVFLPFGRFTDGTRVWDGRVRPPEEPGIGYEANSDLYKLLRTV
jgi:D(-)-tartrate dehydratase